jgi:hypothetical protein
MIVFIDGHRGSLAHSPLIGKFQPAGLELEKRHLP